MTPLEKRHAFISPVLIGRLLSCTHRCQFHHHTIMTKKHPPSGNKIMNHQTFFIVSQYLHEHQSKQTPSPTFHIHLFLPAPQTKVFTTSAYTLASIISLPFPIIIPLPSSHHPHAHLSAGYGGSPARLRVRTSRTHEMPAPGAVVRVQVGGAAGAAFEAVTAGHFERWLC